MVILPSQHRHALEILSQPETGEAFYGCLISYVTAGGKLNVFWKIPFLLVV